MTHRQLSRVSHLLIPAVFALGGLLFATTAFGQTTKDREAESGEDTAQSEAEDPEKTTESDEQKSNSDTESGNEEEEAEEMTEAEREKWRQETRQARRMAITNAAGPNGWLERSWTWDLNLQLGYTREDGSGAWSGRMRTGVARIAEPNAYILGFVGGGGGVAPAAGGLQFEYLSLHYGTFVNLTGMLDLEGQAVAAAGVGWQILGAEVQYRPGEPDNRNWVFTANARLPVSWIIRGIKQTVE